MGDLACNNEAATNKRGGKVIAVFVERAVDAEKHECDENEKDGTCVPGEKKASTSLVRSQIRRFDLRILLRS